METKVLQLFCKISAFLNVIYFVGQFGFNLALIMVLDEHSNLPYQASIIWGVVESGILTFFSVLLLYGLLNNLIVYLIIWCFVAATCIIIFVLITVWAFIVRTSVYVSFFIKLNVAFTFLHLDVIGVIWKTYMIVVLVFILKLCFRMKGLKENRSTGA